MKNLRRKVFGAPYDFDHKGKAFIWLIVIILVGLVFVYNLARTIWPPEETVYAALDFVHVNRFGEVTIKSAEDIQWFIGKEKAVPLLTAMDARNKQIAELRGRARSILAEFSRRSPPGLNAQITAVIRALENGEPTERPSVTVGLDTNSLRCKFRKFIENRLPQERNEPSPVASLDAIRAQLIAINQTLQEREIIDAALIDFRYAFLADLNESFAQLENVLRSSCTNESSASVALARLGVLRHRLAQFDGYSLREDKSPARTPLAEKDGGLKGASISTAALTDAAASGGAANKPLMPSGAKKTLDELVSTLRGDLAELNIAFAGPYRPSDRPSFLFASLVQRNLDTVIANGGFDTAAELQSILSRLDALREDQLAAVLSMRQPERFNLFWSTSRGMIWEIIFWSLFGLCTNLLLNAAEAVRQKTFRPAERIVALTKLAYGPAVALVLSLALLNGLVQLMGEETRVWSLPLLAFLFGFNARKTATVVDRLSEKALGKVSKSIDEQAEERQAKMRQDVKEIQAAAPKVSSFDDLKAEAYRQGTAILRDIIKKRENER